MDGEIYGDRPSMNCHLRGSFGGGLDEGKICGPCITPGIPESSQGILPATSHPGLLKPHPVYSQPKIVAADLATASFLWRLCSTACIVPSPRPANSHVDNP